MQVIQNPKVPIFDLKSFLRGVQTKMEQLATSQAQGQLKSAALYQIQNPGKKLRSQLIYHLATALGSSDFESVTLWAAANELMHEATLIHDDIQDQDGMRRGKASLWKVFGQAQSINTGDFLLMLSLKPLTIIGTTELIQTHIDASLKLAQGQAEEIDQKQSLKLEPDFYTNCIEKKTASLFSSLAKGVGLLLKLENDQILEAEKVFLKLGCIFQMQDDILDLYGNKGRENYGCDIKEGKVSFLIHMHMMHFLEDKDHINALLSKDYTQTTESDVKKLQDIFNKKQTLSLCIDHLKNEIFKLKEDSKKTQIFNTHTHLLDTYIDLITKPISHLL